MSFVSGTTTVQCDLAALRDVFDVPHAGWLVPFVRLGSLEGRAEAEQMRARFALDVEAGDSRPRGATVHLADRSVRIEPPAICVDVSWEACGYGQGLERFSGRFVAVPVSRSECMLTLEGNYASAATQDFERRLTERRAGECAVRAVIRLLRVAVEEAQDRVL